MVVKKPEGIAFEMVPINIFRRGGRFAITMPTHTSLMLQVLRPIASYITSWDLRNLAVIGILAMEIPVPLLCVSISVSTVNQGQYLHESHEKNDSYAPLRLLAKLDVPQVYYRRRSIDLHRVSSRIVVRRVLRVGTKSVSMFEAICT
jgi:hypothetical protein